MRGGEQENVNRAQGFCQQKLDWLVKACSHHLRRMGVPDHVMSARECAQDIFIGCEKITDGAWSDVRDPEAYVAGMVSHHVAKVARRKAPRGHACVESLDKLTADDEPFTPARQEDDLLLEEILAQLDADERQLIEMVYDGLGQKAIAEITGQSYGAFRQRLHRLRERVRALCGRRATRSPRKAGA